MSWVACTIVASNYIAQARVLRGSLAIVHPNVDFVTLIVDGREQDRGLDGLGRVVLGDDLPLDQVTLHSMMAIYDVMELSTALKPVLLTALLSDGASAVAYLDPDIYVYDRLDQLFESATESGICLTPHVIEPFPRDGKLVSEQQVMWAGIFNLGFIAVSSVARPMLEWWGDRTRAHAISDPQNALFTDQRWIDWVPAIATPHVERDPGFNVAHWNTHERPISNVAGAWFAAGMPLRFFHFSGYDPETPWLLTKHAADNPRSRLSESPELRTLCDGYGAKLIQAGHPESRLKPYRWSRLATGTLLTGEIRRLLRQILLGELDCASRPPDPFDDPVAFDKWLQEEQFGSAVQALTPLQFSQWLGRPDLQALFPDPLGSSGGAYLVWLAADEPGSPPRARQATQESQSGRTWLVITGDPPGTDEQDAARLVVDAMRAAGCEVRLVDASQLGAGAATDVIDRESVATVVYCITESQASRLGLRFGIEPPATRRIALLLCSAADLSQETRSLVAEMDEIWAATSWIESSVAEHALGVARRVRIPVEALSSQSALSRSSVGLSERSFVFLAEPRTGQSARALFESYVESFASDELTTLVIVEDGLSPREVERIRSDSRSRRDVVLMRVADRSRHVLLRQADCWVTFDVRTDYSAEIAHVVTAGVPVIAVDHAANLEHVNESNAALVPLATGSERIDASHAVRTLRSMVRYPSKGRRLAAAALLSLTVTHSITAAGLALAPALLPLSGEPQ